MANDSKAERWRLIRGTNLKSEDRHCLLTLFFFQGDNEAAFCRQETLADEIGVHPRSVRRSLQRLNDAGVIASNWQLMNGVPMRTYAIDFEKLKSVQRGNGRTPASYPETGDGRTPVSSAVGHQRPNHQDASVLHEVSIEVSIENPKGSIPENLNCDQFRAAWAQWLEYRREIRKKLPPSTVAKQLATLAAWGPEKAIRAINVSIGNGWQGLFDPDPKPGRSGSVAADKAWHTLKSALRQVDKSRPYKDELRKAIGDRIFDAAESVGFRSLFDISEFNEAKLFSAFSGALAQVTTISGVAG